MNAIAKLALGIALLVNVAYLSAQPSEVTAPAPDPLKVLLIGNSLTYYNDMPSMLQSLAEASGAGPRMLVRSETIPSTKTSIVLGRRPVRYLISDERWDYIILQARPVIDDPEDLYTAVNDLQEAINKSGAKLVLYVTWRGSFNRIGMFPVAAEATTHLYITLADRLNALVAPVGPAWAQALESDASLPLFDPDGLHPTRMGSYLAACVIFLTLQPAQTSCPTLSIDGMKPDQLTVLKAAASSAADRVAPSRRAK